MLRPSICLLYFSLCLIAEGSSPDHSVINEVKLSSSNSDQQELKRTPEDSIPVIEIKGEGKPMSSAQIRHLEEVSNGGPLDIKVDKTWVPAICSRAAKRLDFITFHYKVFTETGKKVDQTYIRHKAGVRIQLGTGMIIPGLEKGMKGMCDQELRKIQIPHRLSRKHKSKMWKHIPNDEHWLTFNIEMLSVEEWTPVRQFEFMNSNNDSYLTQAELVKFTEKMRREYGKNWSNEDIDDVSAAKYYISYFDKNDDGKVDIEEFVYIIERDRKIASSLRKEKKKKSVQKVGEEMEGRLRDPGIGWILDFNNDGYVSVEENDSADQTLEHPPVLLPNAPMARDEL